jgi:hypothetical protein
MGGIPGKGMSCRILSHPTEGKWSDEIIRLTINKTELQLVMFSSSYLMLYSHCVTQLFSADIQKP